MSTQGVRDIKPCARCGHPKHVHDIEHGCMTALYLKGKHLCSCRGYFKERERPEGERPAEQNNAPCDICYKQDGALMVESNLYEALGNFDTLARDFSPVVGSNYLDLTNAIDELYTAMDVVMDRVLADLQNRHACKEAVDE